MAHAHPVPTHYRADIDGLRAVAVLSVLAFHAFPGTLTGGFVGVDVFFVISGYLISGILLEEVANDRFSIVRFYVRRARRLFPALILVMAVTALAGWALLFPWEFKMLGKHLLAGAFFVSNLTLWSELGYFDPGSDTKPLLHLWSLAVEEQYYLVWPLLVALLARRHVVRLAQIVWVLSLCSLAACIYYSLRSPSLAFYLPVTRFWELLAGAGLAIWPRWRLANRAASGATPSPVSAPGADRTASAASVVGLLAIVGSLIAFNHDTVFPGWSAVLPVAGAVLLIAAGPAAPVNRWLLGSPLMVWIGLLSYPLYLWHWPILALLKVVLGEADSGAIRAAGLLLAMALAWLTFTCVEGPLRGSERGWRPGRMALVMWSVVIALGLLGAMEWRGWMPARSMASPAVVEADHARAELRETVDGAWVGGQPGKVLFFGDSHMQHYQARIERLMKEDPSEHHSVQFKTRSGCAPVSGLTRVSLDCGDFVDEGLTLAKAPDVKTVVLAASWVGFAGRADHVRPGDPRRRHVDPLAPGSEWIYERWTQDLLALTRAGKRVVIVLSSPRGKMVDPAQRIVRTDPHWPEIAAGGQDRAALNALVAPIEARVRQVAAAVGAETLDPKAFLCGPTLCPAADAQGHAIYMDDSHLRTSWAVDHVRYLDGLVRPAGVAVAATTSH